MEGKWWGAVLSNIGETLKVEDITELIAGKVGWGGLATCHVKWRGQGYVGRQTLEVVSYGRWRREIPTQNSDAWSISAETRKLSGHREDRIWCPCHNWLEENRLFHGGPTIKWERQEEEVNSTSQHRRVNLFCYLDYVYVCAMIRCLLVIPQFDYWCIKTYQKHNNNNVIRYERPSLAIMHTWRHNTCFNHTARLTSWRTLMACFALSPNRPLTRKRHCNREWG